MLETDYLYPRDMIEQSEEAIRLLHKENEGILLLQEKILNFVEDELLISEKISMKKTYFYNYFYKLEKIRRNNEKNILAFENLRDLIAREIHQDLCGDVIFSMKRSADFNYESEKKKADYYEKLAVMNVGFPMMNMVLYNYAREHFEQASYWKQISDNCMEKMNLFDRIEQNTAGLFSEKNIDIRMETVDNKSNVNVETSVKYTIDISDLSIIDMQQKGNKVSEEHLNEGIVLFRQILTNAGYTDAQIEGIIYELKKQYSSLLVSLYITNCYSASDYNKIKEYLLQYSIKNCKNTVSCEVPLYGQKRSNTCGSACGSMILNSLGLSVDEEEFWNYSNSNGEGTYVYRITATLNHYIGEEIYKYENTSEISDEDYYRLLYNSLENGYPVQVVGTFSQSSVFGYNSGGHYVLVTGVYVNDEGNYIAQINDPFSADGINNPQKVEISLAELHQCNIQHSGYIICYQ